MVDRIADRIARMASPMELLSPCFRSVVGLCRDRSVHPPHVHQSESLGTFWCHANQELREPYASERRRLSCGPVGSDE